MRYLVSCDWNTAGQDRQLLRDALTALGARRVLKAQWILIQNGTTCRQLLNRLVRYLGADDRLLVSDLDGPNWAGYNLMAEPSAVSRRLAG